MLISWAREREIGAADAPRAIYRLGSPAVVLVVLPVLLQLRGRLADEARLAEVPLDRAPDLPAVKHRRALVVQQWRVLVHHVQQMQTFVLAELVPPPTIILFLSLLLGETARPHALRNPAVSLRPPELSHELFFRPTPLPRSPEDSRAATQSSTLVPAFVSTCKTCYPRCADFSSRCARHRRVRCLKRRLTPRATMEEGRKSRRRFIDARTQAPSLRNPFSGPYFYVALE